MVKLCVKIVNEKLLAIVTKLFKLKVDEKAKNLVMQELLKQTTIKEKKNRILPVQLFRWLDLHVFLPLNSNLIT